ncbi:MAG: hypothetical protein ACI8YI_002293, partial [Paracoccaceae bacterium]
KIDYLTFTSLKATILPRFDVHKRLKVAHYVRVYL